MTVGAIAGCANSASLRPTARQLPATPEYVQSVEVEPQIGQDEFNYCQLERAGRIKANGINGSFKEWYEKLRNEYAQTPK